MTSPTASLPWLLTVVTLLGGCGDPTEPLDAGQDAGPADVDAGTDAGPPPEVDAGPPPPPPDADVTPLFDLESARAGEFFDFPFPSALRTNAAGAPDMTGFPRSMGGLVAAAREVVETSRPGFSAAGAVYVRFTGALDPASLPVDPEASVEDGSSVMLIDVDEASPRFGERLPVRVRFQNDATTYWRFNTLAVAAIPGVHMRPGTTYAAVVMDTVSPAHPDAELVPDATFEALKRGEGPAELVDHYDEVFAAIEGQGLDRADVLMAVMFTTSDPAVEMDALRRHLMTVDLPRVGEWTLEESTTDYIAWSSTFDVVEFFSGEPPYTSRLGDGVFEFGADGEVTSTRRTPTRLTVTVPNQAQPEGGWPVVVYGHGTGGDSTSHLGPRGEGKHLAREGIAVLGFDSALHGIRGDGIDIETIVVSNIVVGREVFRQHAADAMLVMRMLREDAFVIPAERAGEEVRFDADPMLYMGHSQGAQAAGIMLGVETGLDAAFFSEGGAGGIITVFERMFGGMSIACAVAPLAGERCDLLSDDHPLMTLIIQPILDPADAVNFAHRVYREPRPGATPTHVAITEATEDNETPPGSIEAMAVTMGVPIVEPVVQRLEAYRLGGAPSVVAPVRENLALADGTRVTAGVIQFEGFGHFVIYEEADARNQYTTFLSSIVADGAPTIPGY